MGQKISHKALHIMDPVDHVFLKHASYHFYIFRVAQSEKIMVHNTNGVNQKDILLKPF